ncbi:MAG: hypothetical protein EOO38_13725, partial [Cytophagaceae bacterium]
MPAPTLTELTARDSSLAGVVDGNSVSSDKPTSSVFAAATSVVVATADAERPMRGREAAAWRDSSASEFLRVRGSLDAISTAKDIHGLMDTLVSPSTCI